MLQDVTGLSKNLQKILHFGLKGGSLFTREKEMSSVGSNQGSTFEVYRASVAKNRGSVEMGPALPYRRTTPSVSQSTPPSRCEYVEPLYTQIFSFH